MTLTRNARLIFILLLLLLVSLVLQVLAHPQWMYGRPILKMGGLGNGGGSFTYVCKNGTVFEQVTEVDPKVSYVGRLSTQQMAGLKAKLGTSFQAATSRPTDGRIADVGELLIAEYNAGGSQPRTISADEFDDYEKYLSYLEKTAKPATSGQVDKDDWRTLPGVLVPSVDCKPR